jgi:hypothetical protein
MTCKSCCCPHNKMETPQAKGYIEEEEEEKNSIGVPII